MVLGSLSLLNLTLRPQLHSPWRETSPDGALGSSAEMPSSHQGAEAPRRGTGLPLQRAGQTPPDTSTEGTRQWAGATRPPPAAWMALGPLSQALAESLLKLSQTPGLGTPLRAPGWGASHQHPRPPLLMCVKFNPHWS